LVLYNIKMIPVKIILPEKKLLMLYAPPKNYFTIIFILRTKLSLGLCRNTRLQNSIECYTTFQTVDNKAASMYSSMLQSSSQTISCKATYSMVSSCFSRQNSLCHVFLALHHVIHYTTCTQPFTSPCLLHHKSS
jgi:hypothetical protein